MDNKIQADNVIDNKKIILKEELLKILPVTKTADIAVGYFFISGLSVIISSLQKVDKVRLLISNTTDKTTAETLIEAGHSVNNVCIEIERTNSVNDRKKKKTIIDSEENTKRSLEYMSQTNDDETVIKILIEMMKSKQLEVRVYPKEKLHAKAYIFKSKDTAFVKGMGIVGSSNLSLAGMFYNSELNLKTTNPLDVNQLLSWFDELWVDGLEFTEYFNIILKKSWAGTTYSPHDLFRKALYVEYKNKFELKKMDHRWGEKFPKLFDFQKDAVYQGLAIFERYGGVIISDVVGLGKTYVGTAMLKYLESEKYRPLIICPPSLVEMWEMFTEEYEINAKVLSRGQLSTGNIELNQNYKFKNRDLVLIDESHHFKDKGRRQYENLHNFMLSKGAKAILLTATPFSNSEQDIKNQVMLFHKSPQTSIPPANQTDLDEYFKQVKHNKAELSDFLKNIMVRRTRRFVIQQWGKKDANDRSYIPFDNKKQYFPERQMKTNSYDINKVYHQKYNEIVDYLRGNNLTLTRYNVGRHLKPEYQNKKPYSDLVTPGKNLVGLIRIILLKRMESSLEAFTVSVRNFVNGHQLFLNLLDNGDIPLGKIRYKAIYETAQLDYGEIDDIDVFEELSKKVKESNEIKYNIDAFYMKAVRKDIEDDLKIFKRIKELICDLTSETDDKLQTLQKLLNKEYAGKKVLIFSEFSTTVKYLNNKLKWDGIKKCVDSKTKNFLDYARRFDPDNNPSSKSILKSEEISLLIATDVLAEGVNLQAGQVVINYDFHWNPTKLIQRAGRVDRIGTKHDTIIIHNFLPDPTIEADLKLETMVSRKIDEIQRVIGEDNKILKEDEQINTEDVYAIYKCNNDILEKNEKNFIKESKFEKILRDIYRDKPEEWQEYKNISNGIRSSVDVRIGGKLLMVCEDRTEKNGEIRKHYLINQNNDIKEINAQQTLEILESNDDMLYPPPSNYNKLISIGWKQFLDSIEQIKATNSKLEPSQKWVISKLLRIDQNGESDYNDKIDTLRQAYSVPFRNKKLNGELKKLKNNKMSDSDFIEHLDQFYDEYNLGNRSKLDSDENTSPRILYSKYIK